MTLQEIERKIAALKKRYAELEGKLFVAGVMDGAVNDAMGRINAELHRMQKLREDSLVGDLVGDVAPRLPAPAVATKRVVDALPNSFFEMGVFERVDEDPRDNPGDVLGSDVDHKSFFERLANYTATQIAGLIEGTDGSEDERFDRAVKKGYDGTAEQFRKELNAMKMPVRYTHATHQGIFAALVITLRETRYLLECHKQHRVAMLKRIEALETRPTLRYLGVWNPATLYDTGDFVTQDGSVWACKASTQTRPGTADGALYWQMAVRRGRDGKYKDGKPVVEAT